MEDAGGVRDEMPLAEGDEGRQVGVEGGGGVGADRPREVNVGTGEGDGLRVEGEEW